MNGLINYLLILDIYYLLIFITDTIFNIFTTKKLDIKKIVGIIEPLQ